MYDFTDSDRWPKVLALGTHCYTASLLKRIGMRQDSGPFDWLFSTPEIVAHVLDDDFRTFLNPIYHRAIPVEKRPEPHYSLCDHTYYRDRFGRPSVFNHHDVTQPEVLAAYTRRVERFRRLRGDPRVLFVMVSKMPISAEVGAQIESSLAPSRVLLIHVRQTGAGQHPKRFGAAMVVETFSEVGGTAFPDTRDEAAVASLVLLDLAKLRRAEATT